MRQIAGKAAIVTGGGNGIGLGIAEALIEEGVRVAILDRSDAHLTQARDHFAGSNAVMFVRSDVADREWLRRSVEEVRAAFGGIDILCNNAGIAAGGSPADTEFDDWERAMGVNLGGVVNGSKIVAPMMRARGTGGHIVNTASMAALIALPDQAGAYATAKFAVRGFTESLRLTLAPFGIGVSCLCPGLTRSRIMIGAPDDPANVAQHGEVEQSFMTMEGAMEPIEVGRMTVQGIKDNAAYIITHGELRAEFEEDAARIAAAFPADQVAPPGRLAVEAQRRAVSDARRAIVIE